MELTLTGAEGAERSFDAVGAGWARLRDQSSLGNGGWEEAVSGCGGLEKGMRDAAEEAEAGGDHVGEPWRVAAASQKNKALGQKEKSKNAVRVTGQESTAVDWLLCDQEWMKGRFRR